MFAADATEERGRPAEAHRVPSDGHADQRGIFSGGCGQLAQHWGGAKFVFSGGES